MATAQDGFGHYGACPPVLVRLPGHGLVEGTTLSPIDERDEVLVNGDRVRRLEADSVMGIPCDLLPEPYNNDFLPDDIIFFFRRCSEHTNPRQGTISQEFQAHLAIRLATWINFLASMMLIAFLCSFSLIYQTYSITPLGLYGLFAACLIFRLFTLLMTFLVLLHYRTTGLRTRLRYDELCAMSPMLYRLIPASNRARVSDTLLDTFNFLDSVFFGITESALTETAPLLGNHVQYAPLSGPDRLDSLNNGWIILHLARYPDRFTCRWCPRRGILNSIYHLRQDWRRYKAAAVVYQAMKDLGSIASGIAVLEYNIRRIEWESRQPRYAPMGYHFIPRYVGNLEVGDTPEQIV